MLKDKKYSFFLGGGLLCKILSVLRLEFLAFDTSNQESGRVGAVIIQNNTVAPRGKRGAFYAV